MICSVHFQGGLGYCKADPVPIIYNDPAMALRFNKKTTKRKAPRSRSPSVEVKPKYSEAASKVSRVTSTTTSSNSERDEFLHLKPLAVQKNVKNKCKCKFTVKYGECLRNHLSQRLMIKCLTIPDRTGIWKCWFLRKGGGGGGGKTRVPGVKPLGAKKRTNNKLNPHMTPGPGIESGTHWWEANALTTAPSLLVENGDEHSARSADFNVHYLSSAVKHDHNYSSANCSVGNQTKMLTNKIKRSSA